MENIKCRICLKQVQPNAQISHNLSDRIRLDDSNTTLTYQMMLDTVCESLPNRLGAKLPLESAEHSFTRLCSDCSTHLHTTYAFMQKIVHSNAYITSVHSNQLPDDITSSNDSHSMSNGAAAPTPPDTSSQSVRWCKRMYCQNSLNGKITSTTATTTKSGSNKRPNLVLTDKVSNILSKVQKNQYQSNESAATRWLHSTLPHQPKNESAMAQNFATINPRRRHRMLKTSSDMEIGPSSTKDSADENALPTKTATINRKFDSETNLYLNDIRQSRELINSRSKSILNSHWLYD